MRALARARSEVLAGEALAWGTTNSTLGVGGGAQGELDELVLAEKEAAGATK